MTQNEKLVNRIRKDLIRFKAKEAAIHDTWPAAAYELRYEIADLMYQLSELEAGRFV